MTFKSDSVTFINHSDQGFLVEIEAQDGSTIKRQVTDKDLATFCDQHHIDRSLIKDDIAALKRKA